MKPMYIILGISSIILGVAFIVKGFDCFQDGINPTKPTFNKKEVAPIPLDEILWLKVASQRQTL